MEEDATDWYSVRCIFRAEVNTPWGPFDLEPGESAYEERVTLWRAGTAEEAIELAEEDAELYAAQIEVEYLGLAQSCRLAEQPGNGVEVFSLIRKSTLDSRRYVDAFFSTDTEYQGHIGDT